MRAAKSTPNASAKKKGGAPFILILGFKFVRAVFCVILAVVVAALTQAEGFADLASAVVHHALRSTGKWEVNRTHSLNIFSLR